MNRREAEAAVNIANARLRIVVAGAVPLLILDGRPSLASELSEALRTVNSALDRAAFGPFDD